MRTITTVLVLAALAGAVLAHLGQALGAAPFDFEYDPAAVSREIARAVPAFAGIDLESVGSHGLELRDGSH